MTAIVLDLCSNIKGENPRVMPMSAYWMDFCAKIDCITVGLPAFRMSYVSPAATGRRGSSGSLRSQRATASDLSFASKSARH